MSDTYYYFQCLNGACGRDVVVDLRVKDGGKAPTAMVCPLCAGAMDYRGCSAADADGYSVKWEIIVDDFRESVRRLAVPTGWIYQTQDGRKYDTVHGTIGRDNDRGYPTWGSMVFVPKEPR